MTTGTPQRKRISAPGIAARKGDGTPIVMVTAYDAPSARIVDEAGVDVILVGDTLAMVVLGYDDTLQVTTDDMAHHVGAVARTSPQALVVGDLPWLSYHLSTDDTVRNAAALVRAGAGAVKLEGGRKRLGAVRAILDAEIPVMGHLGLTPQSVHALGGFRVQGKELDAARAIVDDAIALADAGCFAVVLECVPDAVARLVTDTVAVPTIGIGAGRHCDGQVLVFHDLLGLEDRLKPKFVRRYAQLAATATGAVARFADDVRAGRFPSSGETYHAADTFPDELRVDGPESRAAGDSEAQEPAPGVTRGALVAAIAAAVLIVAGIALIVVADDGGSDDDGPTGAVGPVAAAVEAATSAPAPFPGLTETRIGVGGRTIDVVVADESDERYQGLRRRRDLGDYDGMLFVFDGSTTTGFTMSTVPVVLDIGFYDAGGRLVDRLRMQPCPQVESECPTYRVSGAFRYALETLAGDLPPGNLGPAG